MSAFAITFDTPTNFIEPIYNHIHHANIIRLLEQGRLTLLDNMGCSMAWFLEQQLHLVIASLEVHYYRELKGGKITVTCSKPVIKSRCIFINQSILLDSGKEAVEATVNSMVFSPKLNRAVTPPQEFINKINMLP